MSIHIRGEAQSVLIANIANELKLIGALPRPRSSFNGPRSLSDSRTHGFSILFIPVVSSRRHPFTLSFLVLSLSGRRTAINPVVAGVRDY